MSKSECNVQKTGQAARLQALAKQALVERRYEDAHGYLDAALETEDDAAAILAQKGQVFSRQGDVLQAIGHYMLAAGEDPENPVYKQAFITLAGRMTLARHNPHFEDMLLSCFMDRRVDCAPARVLWQSLLVNRDDFLTLYKTSNARGYPEFNKKSFDSATDFSPLLTPLFLQGLRRVVVHDIVFEGFLTCLRKTLLEGTGREDKRLSLEARTEIAAALSFYCFETEYIFDCTEEERAGVEALRLRIESDESARDSSFLVALYGCYAPLYTLACADDVLRRAGCQEGMADVVRVQIADWMKLQRTREHIVSLTEITDDVSLRVKEQYEEFPYPRFFAFGGEPEEDAMERRLQGTGAKVLVAGCGTGREALQLAALVPDAEILAVDLSKTSLAYAASMAAAHAMGNVTFRQADILRLGALDETFDVISCGGVLHHMKDPVAGWKTLRGLLRPQGLMRIALYSKAGRREVIEAREAIAREKIPSTRAGMMLFRRECRRLLGRNSLASMLGTGEFYYMSRLRDYLFHVQEHRFDLLQIKTILAELRLEIVRFDVSGQVRALYAKEYPHDDMGANLDNLQAFEEKHPESFSTMYQFWCRSLP